MVAVALFIAGLLALSFKRWIVGVIFLSAMLAVLFVQVVASFILLAVS